MIPGPCQEIGSGAIVKESRRGQDEIPGPCQEIDDRGHRRNSGKQNNRSGVEVSSGGKTIAERRVAETMRQQWGVGWSKTEEEGSIVEVVGGKMWYQAPARKQVVAGRKEIVEVVK